MKHYLLLIFTFFWLGSANAQDVATFDHQFHLDTVHSKHFCHKDHAFLNKLISTPSNPTASIVPNLSIPFNNFTGTPVTCGSFNLYYADIANGSSFGFNDPNDGLDRRNTLCDVLTYIESVFDFSGLNSNIDIYIEASTNNVLAPLANGGPIYPSSMSSTSGIYEGYFFEHLNTGNDPDVNEYDAYLEVNFGHNYHYSTPGNSCQYDLFTVLLHEITHQMGWISFIESGTHPAVNTGTTPFSSISTNTFSKFDELFLHQKQGAAFQKLINTSGGVSSINNNLSVIPFEEEELTENSFGVFMYGLNAGKYNYPVFPEPNTTLSHIDGMEVAFTRRFHEYNGKRSQHIMQPKLAENEFIREYSLEDIRMIMDLGYSLNPTFAGSTSINGSTVNSTLLNNHHPTTTKTLADYEFGQALIQYQFSEHIAADYSMVNDGTSITIDISTDASISDPDGDNISIYPGSLYNIRGCGDGNNHDQLTLLSGTQIQYAPRPDFIGRAQFGFHLTDGKEKGSFMFYTIDVTPGSAFVNNPPGELIINGGFEQGTEVTTDPNNPKTNAAAIHNRQEGMFSHGSTFADSHPYSYTTTHGLIFGHGTVVKDSWNSCTASTNSTPTYGREESSSDVNNTINPTPTINGGNRYHRLGAEDQLNYFDPAWIANPIPLDFMKKGTNFSLLSSNVTECKKYKFSYDIYFDNAFSPNFVYPMDLQFGDQINFPLLNTHYTENIDITVGTTGTWQHIEEEFYYCSSIPSNIINLDVLDLESKKVFIDNLSLVEIIPPAFAVNAGPDQTNCNNSSIQLNATVNEDVCDITYTWTPATGLSDPNIANPIYTPTTGGGNITFTVTATNSLGCVIDSDDITIVNGPYTNISTTPFCQNGSFDLSFNGITGGVAPYTFQWFGPNGFSQSGSGTSDTQIGLTDPGTYTLTITDANNCAYTESINMSPSTISINTSALPTSLCVNDAPLDLNTLVTFSPSNGIATYSNLNGLITITNEFDPSLATSQGNQDIDITYTLPNGCSSTLTHSIMVNDLPQLLSNSLPTSSCILTGAIINIPSGLTYSPSGGTFSYTPVGMVQVPNGDLDPNIAGMGSHSIGIEYEDPNGCIHNSTYNINIGGYPWVSIQSTPFCQGGSFDLSFNGVNNAVAPYTFVWSGPNGFSQSGSGSSDIQTGLTTVGTYSVEVTDNYGCSNISTTTVVSNPSPSLSNSLPATMCANDPSITLSNLLTPSITGGSYTYSCVTANVNTGVFDPATAGLGTHTIEITYTLPSGCSTSITHLIDVLSPPSFNINNMPSFCLGDPITNLTPILNASPANGTYTFSCAATPAAITTNGDFDPNIGVGIYNIDVSYSIGGCSITNQIPMYVGDAPQFTLNNSGNPFCSNGNFTLDFNGVSGGLNSTPYAYVWSNSINGPITSGNGTIGSYTDNTADTYTLTVYDNAGCNASQSVTMTAVAPPVITQTTNIPAICLNAGAFDLSSYFTSTGNISYSANIIPISPTGIITPFALGGFIIDVVSTDPATGCSSILSVSIDVADCCIPIATGVLDWNNTSANSVGITSLTGADIVVTGTFLVDQNLTLTNCTVYMEDNAEILVNSGCTLNIDGTTIQACPGGTVLWSRIAVGDPSSLINITNNCTIRDANTAIHSVNGGEYSIQGTLATGSVFESNRNHIRVENSGTPITGLITGTTFDNSNTLIDGTQGQEGIFIDNVNSINIGYLYATPNIFIDGSKGVFSINSNINIIDCDFEDYTNPGDLACHISGDISLINRCNFDNVRLGVRQENMDDATISGSNFDNCSQRAIVIEDSEIAAVYRNNISNVSIDAIKITTNNNPANSFNIHNNQIDGASTGINLDGQSAGTISNLYAELNNITGVKVGIKSRFLNSVHHIKENYIEYEESSTSGWANAGVGIEIIASDDMKVEKNLIIDMGATALGHSFNGYGCRINNSENINLFENKFVGCHRGLFFVNAFTNTDIECNRFEECYQGIFFNTNNFTSPVTLDIGAPGRASDNAWTLFTVPITIDGFNSANLTLNWYLRDIYTLGNEQYDPNYSSGNNLVSGTLPITFNQIINQADNINCGPPAKQAEDSLVSSIVVYPNPSSGKATIEVEQMGYQLHLFDVLGKMVLTQTLDVGKNQLQLHHLENGVYHCRITHEDGSLQSTSIVISK